MTDKTTIAVPIDIPTYTISSSPPLRTPSGTPPTFSELKRRDQKNKHDRQRWFEDNVLRRIAASSNSSQVPWYFQTPNGERWQLDKGCVGHAMANGVLEPPDNPEAPLWYVQVRRQTVGAESYSSDAEREVERQRRAGAAALRPEQKKFSEAIRRNYIGRCAVTSCNTAEALEAAHIRVLNGSDDNHPSNGILLRRDIHALFDELLITFTPDGKAIEVSPWLTDPTYSFLKGALVAQPAVGPRRAIKNVHDHRARFQRNLLKQS